MVVLLLLWFSSGCGDGYFKGGNSDCCMIAMLSIFGGVFCGASGGGGVVVV